MRAGVGVHRAAWEREYSSLGRVSAGLNGRMAECYGRWLHRLRCACRRLPAWWQGTRQGKNPSHGLRLTKHNGPTTPTTHQSHHQQKPHDTHGTIGKPLCQAPGRAYSVPPILVQAWRLSQWRLLTGAARTNRNMHRHQREQRHKWYVALGRTCCFSQEPTANPDSTASAADVA